MNCVVLGYCEGYLKQSSLVQVYFYLLVLTSWLITEQQSRGVVIHINNQTLCWEMQKEATQMKYLGLLIGVWIKRAPVRMCLISGMFSSFWYPAEFLLELLGEIHIKQPQHWIVELLVWVWDETDEIKTQVEFCTGPGRPWCPRQILPTTFISCTLVHGNSAKVCKSGQICAHCWRGSLLTEALLAWSTLTKRRKAEVSGSGVILPEHFYCPFVIFSSQHRWRENCEQPWYEHLHLIMFAFLKWWVRGGGGVLSIYCPASWKQHYFGCKCCPVPKGSRLHSAATISIPEKMLTEKK